MIVLNKWDKVDSEKISQVGPALHALGFVSCARRRLPLSSRPSTARAACAPLARAPGAVMQRARPAASSPSNHPQTTAGLGLQTPPNPPKPPNPAQSKAAEEALAQLRAISWAPVVCTTASRGRRVEEVVAAVLAVGEQHRRRVPTATLNLVRGAVAVAVAVAFAVARGLGVPSFGGRAALSGDGGRFWVPPPGRLASRKPPRLPPPRPATLNAGRPIPLLSGLPPRWCARPWHGRRPRPCAAAGARGAFTTRLRPPRGRPRLSCLSTTPGCSRTTTGGGCGFKGRL